MAVRFHKIEEHFKQFREKVVEKYRSVGGYKKTRQSRSTSSGDLRKLNEYGTGVNLP